MEKIDTFVTESDLLLYPEVNWDRFGRDYAFGWIKREDGKFDFAILAYYQREDGSVDVSITSSSAKYSQEFGKRLGAKDHQDCIRIENFFDIPNKIILNKNEQKNTKEPGL